MARTGEAAGSSLLLIISRKDTSKCEVDPTKKPLKRVYAGMRGGVMPACNGAQPQHMMEEDMTNSTPETKDIAARRSFFGHLGGAAPLGLACLVPKAFHAQAPAARSVCPDSPGTDA